LAEQLLQINFALNVSPAEYKTLAAGVAEAFAHVPGLRWKVWFLDDATREAGGIYLFEDEQALNTFLASDLGKVVGTHPAFRGATLKHSAVMPEVTAITRGPVGAAVGV